MSNNRIAGVLHEVFQFLTNFRRSGTTTFVKKIAAENDVMVIVATVEEARDFGDKAIALIDLKKHHGDSPKPLLIESSVFLNISEDAYKQITYSQKVIERQREVLGSIRRQIDDLDKELMGFDQSFQTKKTLFYPPFR